MSDFVLVPPGPDQPPFVLSLVIVLLSLPCVPNLCALFPWSLSGSIWLTVVPFHTLVSFVWSLYLLPCIACCRFWVDLSWFQSSFFSFLLLLFIVISFRFSAKQPEQSSWDSICLNFGWGGLWSNCLRSYSPSARSYLGMYVDWVMT